LHGWHAAGEPVYLADPAKRELDVSRKLLAVVAAIRRQTLLVGLALALTVRIAYVLLIPDAITRWRDGISYDEIATNLVSGVGYRDETGEWPGEPPYADPSAPTARWLPGYPLFIAGVYQIFGHSYRAVYLAQAVLGLAIAGLVYRLAKPTLGATTGVLAVYLYAIDPFSIFLCGRFQTEQLFAFLVLASLDSFLRMRVGGRAAVTSAALFGLLAGLAALTRTVAGIAFAGLCLTVLVGLDEGAGRASFARRVLMVGLAALVFLGTLAPWVIRVQGLTGRYALSTETWQTLAMTNNDSGSVNFTPAGLEAMPRTSIQQSEIERETIYRRFVTTWVREHPSRFGRLYLWRAVAFWSPSLDTVSGAQATIGLGFNVILLVFAASCLVSHRSQWHRLLPLYVVPFTFTLGYASVAAITRFRVPLNPILAILAAGGILAVASAWRLLAGARHFHGRTDADPA